MQTEKKTVTELLNLPVGKTTDDILLALMDSELMDDTPTEKMITCAKAYFKLVANTNGMDREIVNALYMMETLFAYYSELASRYDDGKKERKSEFILTS